MEEEKEINTNDKKEVEEDENLEIKSKDIKEIDAKKNSRANNINSNIALNKFYTVSINSDNDDDSFNGYFSVPNDRLITIRVKRITDNNSVNFRVKLLSQDGKEEFLYGSEYGENVVYKVPVKAGKYKVCLESLFYVYGSKSYKSQYKVEFLKSNEYEKENNDTIETANKILLNKEYKGIGNEGTLFDRDVFKFTTNRDGNVTLRIRTNPNVDIGSTIICDRNGRAVEYLFKKDYKIKKDYKGSYLEYTLKDIKKDNYSVDIKFYDKKVNYKIEVSQGATDQTKFNDIAGHFAEYDIVNFVNKGYTQGYSDGTFRPNKAITRAEFIKFTNKVFGYTAQVSSESFTDVKPSDWFYYEVKAALKAGYISKNSKFRPNDPITREEVASIITSIKNKKDWNLDKLNKYIDRNQVASWAKPSVEGAIEQGYMGKGSNKFRPKSNITRAEAVVTLSRAKSK